MISESENKLKTQGAHSYDSKKRTEDVKTQEDLTFSDLHISSQVLKGFKY